MTFIAQYDQFRVEPFLEAADILCKLDEPERALKLLDNLPGYYRDFPPDEIKALKLDIQKALLTPHAYASVDHDSEVGRHTELMEGTNRGAWVKQSVEQYNELRRVPHVVDMGPGEYWLPIGLFNRSYRFTYHDIALLQRTGRQARETVPGYVWQPNPKDDQPIIFVAFELIEHLADVQEIALEAARHCGRLPDKVFLSTPLYTYAEQKDWRKCQPHRRTYTPAEFIYAAHSLFQGYKWELQTDALMTLKGER